MPTTTLEDPLETVIEKTKKKIAETKEEARWAEEAERAVRSQCRQMVMNALKEANSHLERALGSLAFLNLLKHIGHPALFSFTPSDPHRCQCVFRLLGAEKPAERKGVWICLVQRENRGRALEIFEEDTAESILREYPSDRFEFLPETLQNRLQELAKTPEAIAILVTEATFK